MADDLHPPLPGEPPSLEPRSCWTDLERWVWDAVGTGRPANIDDYAGLPAPNPDSSVDWTSKRRLSADFLQTIALHEPYRSALPRHGIEIIGAWFEEPIDLRDGRVTGVLWLHRCRFEQVVGFNGLKSESVVSLSGSAFEGDLDMRAVEISGGLYLRNGARFKSVNLYGSRIGRNLNISRASFHGRLILNAIKVGGNLVGVDSIYHRDVGLKGAAVEGMVDLRRNIFKDRLDMWWLKTGQDLLLGGMVGEETAPAKASYFLLDCRNAKIGGQLNLSHVEIAESLNLASITIANEALLGRGSSFGNINLRLAKIGQHLNLAMATVCGRLNLTGVVVGQDISFKRSKMLEKIDLVFAEIEGNLQLCGGNFDVVDLTGTRIGAELRLTNDEGPPLWSPTAQLVLRNTRADAVHDTTDAWPGKIELDGFVYNGFGGLDADATHDLGNRRSPWFIAWLEKDAPHTPQPYRQCANVLQAMGHPAIADDVLYAGRERERTELKRNNEDLMALGLWFLKATIGYGHGASRYFRALYWVASLTVLGVVVLMATGDYLSLDSNNISWADSTDRQQFMHLVKAASFSLNKLLPVIDLPLHHAHVLLSTGSKLYFQFHKLMGYVLALFLVAGITGLTK
ncbi:MAG: hypothetical protein ACRBM6_17985 [Geminicoccales bacterium]